MICTLSSDWRPTRKKRYTSSIRDERSYNDPSCEKEYLILSVHNSHPRYTQQKSLTSLLSRHFSNEWEFSFLYLPLILLAKNPAFSRVNCGIFLICNSRNNRSYYCRAAAIAYRNTLQNMQRRELINLDNNKFNRTESVYERDIVL